MASVPLNLVASPRAKAFRAIDTLLRHATNSPLRRANPQFKSYTGQITDIEPFPETVPVGITLSFGDSDVGFYSPDSYKVDFTIQVDVEIQSLIADDMANLWYAIERTIFPHSDATATPVNAASLKIQAVLNAAGIWQGIVKFRAPGIGKIENGRMYGTGLLHMQVYEVANP